MKLFLTALLAALSTSTAFAGEKFSMPDKNANPIIPDHLIEKLSGKKIYFGHQSVGRNIMLGIEELLTEEQKKRLPIIKASNPRAYQGNLFAHSDVGRNRDPLSKLKGFDRQLDRVGNWQPDIAMLKFCYVDVEKNADVETLFRQYQERMQQVKLKHPDVKLVHFTVPLRTVQSGVKASIKQLIGRQLEGAADNIQRHRYNELLRKAYAGKEPIFDIAKIESTREDGSRETFTQGGKTYYALVPEYSNDGGHLNRRGRAWVAKHLLEFLAEL